MTATTTTAMTPLDLAAEGLQDVPLSAADHIEQGSVASGTKGLTKGILWKASRDRIKVLPGLNVRGDTADYRAHVSSIARSMHAEGWFDDKPLACFVDAEGLLVVKDGHTRLQAYDEAVALGAEIAYIPVVASSDYNMADITVGLVKSNTGRALRPVEVAVVCKRLQGWGWEASKIAERLDMSAAYVGELLALLAAPPALVALVQDGTVSASTAVKAIKQRGAKAASEAIVAAVEVKKEEAAAAAPTKPGKAPKALKVVDSDLGQSKAQVAVKKAAPKASGGGLPECLAALRAVFDDPAFNGLADKAQQAVLAIVNP